MVLGGCRYGLFSNPDHTLQAENAEGGRMYRLRGVFELKVRGLRMGTQQQLIWHKIIWLFL